MATRRFFRSLDPLGVLTPSDGGRSPSSYPLRMLSAVARQLLLPGLPVAAGECVPIRWLPEYGRATDVHQAARTLGLRYGWV